MISETNAFEYNIRKEEEEEGRGKPKTSYYSK